MSIRKKNLEEMEFDSGNAAKGNLDKVNSPHARETPAHNTATNSTSPFKGGKKANLGELGMRPR